MEPGQDLERRRSADAFELLWEVGGYRKRTGTNGKALGYIEVG